jgi:hypothetical protein
MKQICKIVAFFEDLAHERFLTALIVRAGQEVGVPVEVQIRSATHGSRVWKELSHYLRDVRKDPESLPDILVVSMDSDCKESAEIKKEVKALVEKSDFRAAVVCAIPKPHMERWYLEDQRALSEVIPGVTYQKLKEKCERDWYKRALIETIRRAGIEPSLGGAEYGAEIAQKLNPERMDESFRDFWKELLRVMREWRGK